MKRVIFVSTYDEKNDTEVFFIAKTKNGILLKINIDEISNHDRYIEFFETIESEILTMYAKGTDLIEVTNKGFKRLCNDLNDFKVLHRVINLNLCKVFDRSHKSKKYLLETEEQIKKIAKNNRYQILNQ